MANTIRPEKARNLAYSWHSGQWSPLYAFASSGLIESPGKLAAEIDAAKREALDKKDLLDLDRLDRYIQHKVSSDPRLAWDGRMYHVAPWGIKNLTKKTETESC
jgi:hypothetical protein